MLFINSQMFSSWFIFLHLNNCQLCTTFYLESYLLAWMRFLGMMFRSIILERDWIPVWRWEGRGICVYRTNKGCCLLAVETS